MDTELLRSFIAVVDTGSFTRAARQIFRTQAAVSQQMKRLEQSLGKTLFDREGRVLELTADGKALVSYARRILNLHDEALQKLQQEPERRPLRIGCPDDYLVTVMPKLIDLIHRHLPGLEVQVFGGSSSRLRPQLDAGELDLSVMTRHAGSDEGYLLYQDQGVWVLPAGKSPHDYDCLPLALAEPDCKFHSTALDGLDKLGRDYQVLAVANSTLFLSEMVRQNGMISAMIRSSAPEDLSLVEAGTLLPELTSVSVALVMSATAHPKVPAALVQQVSQGFAAGLSGAD